MSYSFLRKKNLDLVNGFLVDLSSPSNLSYSWNFGSLLGIVFMLQLITGIFLTFHYAAHVNLAFESVVHIMRDVNYGWVIRYFHINGASFFFLFVYIHISRGIYFMSFLKKMVWISGVVILLVLMMVAFMGYILPWGQMSFWGATVITNLLSSLPFWGTEIVLWIWGGFSVDNPTLNRFFSFHFLFPLVLVVFVFFHLVFLHSSGSSNALGLSFHYDKIYFYSYFFVKDVLAFVLFVLVLGFLGFFNPLALVDSENFISANSLVTPPHIQPEWYFLISYAILRSVPNKLGGVVALFLSILVLLSLMFVEGKFGHLGFYPFMKVLFSSFGACAVILMWVGASQVEYPFYSLGQLGAGFFFFFFYMYYYFIFFWDSFFS